MVIASAIQRMVVREIPVDQGLKGGRVLDALVRAGFEVEVRDPEIVYSIGARDRQYRLLFPQDLELVCPGRDITDPGLCDFLEEAGLRFANPSLTSAAFILNPQLAKNYPTCVRWNHRGWCAMIFDGCDDKLIVTVRRLLHNSPAGYYPAGVWFPVENQ